MLKIDTMLYSLRVFIHSSVQLPLHSDKFQLTENNNTVDALICVQYGTGLTTGAFAHHFDASLCIALGLLQLTLIGIGGGVGSAHWRHHGRTYNLLTHTFSFRGVSRVSFTQRSKSTQLPSATYGDRDKDIRVQNQKDTIM